MQTKDDKTAMLGTPAIQKPTAATSPWPIAVPITPNTTERVVFTRMSVNSAAKPPDIRLMNCTVRSDNV